MRRALAVALAFVALSGLRPMTDMAAQTGGWTTLLDGTTLKGWNIIGDANWEVADGAVQATRGMGGFLVTPQPYGDFQLQLEFWVTDDANSGVFIRCQDPKNVTAMNSYEVNIYDQRPDPAYRTGAIVNVAKPIEMLNTGGKWNTFDITAQGPKLIVVLNGRKTVDTEDKQFARGPIALQYGSGTVKFRNVRVRTL